MFEKMAAGVKEWIATAEDLAEKVSHHYKRILPHLARFCLVSTFFEDGLRMWTQWTAHSEFVSLINGCGWFLGTLFVTLNLIGQLGGVAMVLLRIRVNIACGLLLGVICLQTLAYRVMWNMEFLSRNLALVGALLLVLAESYSESKSQFAGVPSLDEKKPKNYLQLTGRVLLTLMFTTTIKFDTSIFSTLQNFIGSALMVLVAIGYKTKLSSLVLVLWLNFLNFYSNAWWSIPSYQHQREWKKYDFFQTLSVIGGLLMVASIGPGGVSVDEHKKDW